MKKILLLCSIVLSVFAATAQTKHTKKVKKNTISREARIQARLDSQLVSRQLRIDSMITGQVHTDSLRRVNDSLAYVKYTEERLAANETKLREVDSLNKEHVKMLSKEQQQASTIQEQRNVINKAAKLNDYQGQQVDFINQSFYSKAQKIKQDSALAANDKMAQLLKLNDERRSRLKTVIGKSKEKKLEKSRKAHTNMNDTEVQWISEVEGFAKN